MGVKGLTVVDQAIFPGKVELNIVPPTVKTYL